MKRAALVLLALALCALSFYAGTRFGRAKKDLSDFDRIWNLETDGGH